MIFLLIINLALADNLDMECASHIKDICGTMPIKSPPDKMTNEERSVLSCRIKELVKCIKKDK